MWPDSRRIESYTYPSTDTPSCAENDSPPFLDGAHSSLTPSSRPSRAAAPTPAVRPQLPPASTRWRRPSLQPLCPIGSLPPFPGRFGRKNPYEAFRRSTHRHSFESSLVNGHAQDVRYGRHSCTRNKVKQFASPPRAPELQRSAEKRFGFPRDEHHSRLRLCRRLS